MPRSSGTYSSDGIQTSTANQVINFEHPLNCLFFTALNSSVNIKLNNETNYHYTPQGKTLKITDMDIRKIEIQEAGVQYLYEAQYY
jgi:hypothetical protein